MEELDEDLGKIKSKQEIDKDIEEDFDLDLPDDLFGDYGEDINDKVGSVDDIKHPEVSGLRSRFSLGEQSCNLLASLDISIAKLGVEVFTYTQDINKLKKYYALLSEKFQQIKWVFGTHVHKTVSKLRYTCLNKINKNYKNDIPKDVHQSLFKLRDKMDQLSQLHNFRFEVERTRSGSFQKIKRRMSS